MILFAKDFWHFQCCFWARLIVFIAFARVILIFLSSFCFRSSVLWAEVPADQSFLLYSYGWTLPVDIPSPYFCVQVLSLPSWAVSVHFAYSWGALQKQLYFRSDPAFSFQKESSALAGISKWTDWRCATIFWPAQVVDRDWVGFLCLSVAASSYRESYWRSHPISITHFDTSSSVVQGQWSFSCSLLSFSTTQTSASQPGSGSFPSVNPCLKLFITVLLMGDLIMWICLFGL